MKQEEELMLTGEEKLILKKDYLPYSYWRIVEILKNYYNAELQLVRGYKEGRWNPYYKQHYKIVDRSTQKVLNEKVYLEDLRYFFARKGFPIIDPKRIQARDSKRSKGAEAYLRSIKRSQQREGEGL